MWYTISGGYTVKIQEENVFDKILDLYHVYSLRQINHHWLLFIKKYIKLLVREVYLIQCHVCQK